jgi:hypothetical protein
MTSCEGALFGESVCVRARSQSFEMLAVSCADDELRGRDVSLL